MRRPPRALAALAAWSVIAASAAPPAAEAASPGVARPDAETASLVAEVRRSFTIHGKPIPPEIFRDFGDGDLGDSSDIWVTVNVAAAVGSNLYFDDIKEEKKGWFTQRPAGGRPHAGEETSYHFVGATANGLLVVIASYSGGGSGVFYTLHILDLAPARAFDLEGKLYWQINLTSLRSIALGDRWDGDVSIAKNSIRVVTTRKGPADDSGARTTMTIAAERP